ncbi:hypothetical protein [Bacillus smithii]|uniref:hypothetical protein n=1 Tax=Bacillus smithii TaxID=1479 RepID=UPI002E2246D4|nr:hypothetical protein [Bacillus smithii]
MNENEIVKYVITDIPKELDIEEVGIALKGTIFIQFIRAVFKRMLRFLNILLCRLRYGTRD